MNHPALCNAVAVKVHQHVFDAQPAGGQAVVLVIHVVILRPAGAIGALAPVVFLLPIRERIF